VSNFIAGLFSRRWQHMLQDQRCGVAFKRYLQTSVAPLGLLAFLASGSMDARLIFRVKNLTNKLYASWGDPGYTDQIILGAPRSYEVAASFKW
jgi:hypothetical protein